MARKGKAWLGEERTGLAIQAGMERRGQARLGRDRKVLDRQDRIKDQIPPRKAATGVTAPITNNNRNRTIANDNHKN